MRLGLGANMAATKIFAPVLFMIFIAYSSELQNFNQVKNIPDSLVTCEKRDIDYLEGLSTKIVLVCRNTRRMRIRKVINVWNKHGYLTLAIPEVFVCIDIAMYMDVERNPGPNLDNAVSVGDKDKQYLMSRYSKYDLTSLRKVNIKPSYDIIENLKINGIFKYRGSRGGRTRNMGKSKIPVVIGRRPVMHVRPKRHNYANLIKINRSGKRNATERTSHYAVPKCLFLNICSLLKVKNGVKATLALEGDLYAEDIDVCIISETHLNHNVPDSAVGISNYTIYRRDRDCFGNDNRKKGGVAIYMRNNLKVKKVTKSDRYECVALEIELPSGHCMLVCGLYHPPRVNYLEMDLIEYLIEIMDIFLEENPNALIVCGGDLNHLDLDLFSTMSGLKALVDFPTRAQSVLDNCLTNNESLFKKCYPITPHMKTDHKGVVLPAGIKVKPVRFVYRTHDYREHRKIEFRKKLLNYVSNWEHFETNVDVDAMVKGLQSDLCNLMEKCFPAKTVRVSSRDPLWITPLVKILMKKRARLVARGVQGDSISLLTERIGKVIMENRMALESGRKGSWAWWRKINMLTHRKDSQSLNLDNDFIHNLNDYFGGLCKDENYIKPIPMEISDNEDAPRLSTFMVFNALSKIKRTATGPDDIPYWIWKDHAKILTPVVECVWNWSLKMQRWPSPWKESNINPVPKVEVPVEDIDFRGINVTPVIARAFERVVYEVFCKKDIEMYLGKNQHAYRSGGSCINALLKMQYDILCALDNPRNKAVRLFTMDFSKAFDNVKHHLLVEKMKASPLCPHLVNWYISFLSDRRQRVVHNGVLCEWIDVNKGTIQGSVSGPYLFCIFVNDLDIEGLEGVSLSKYADDSNLSVAVNNDEDNSDMALAQFLDWSKENDMKCNTIKCKELVIRKKSSAAIDYPIRHNIKQYSHVKILGLTFQSNGKFMMHVKAKLVEANRCLYVIRGMRNEGYNQEDIDLFFKSVVLSKITYGLPVFGACNAELNMINSFLNRCFKRHYTTKLFDIYELLKQCDKRLFYKIKVNVCHPLYSLLPKVKESSMRLRQRTSQLPRVNTERFKNSFVNRLYFRYKLTV